jgi:hypothetical protein
MVVGAVNGAVWNAIPSPAGTGAQSHPGLAAQTFPLGGRLVVGRTLGFSVKVVLSRAWFGRGVSDPPEPKYSFVDVPFGGQLEKSAL